jgi:hypothetical protein
MLQQIGCKGLIVTMAHVSATAGLQPALAHLPQLAAKSEPPDESRSPGAQHA